jgi:hypothetical protein
LLHSLPFVVKPPDGGSGGDSPCPIGWAIWFAVDVISFVPAGMLELKIVVISADTTEPRHAHARAVKVTLSPLELEPAGTLVPVAQVPQQ